MKNDEREPDIVLIDRDIKYHKSKIKEHQKYIDNLKRCRNLLKLKK